MPRRIVILSDGTGNAAKKLFKTNVWRMYQAINLSSARQVAYYDDGVGTSSLWPLAMLGGMFGWGLKRNVLGLYMFLCRNYAEGDQIYGFGFSRGAFTIRVLIKFVLAKGLVRNFMSNDDLRRKAQQRYREFRKDSARQLVIPTLVRAIRDFLFSPFWPLDRHTTWVNEIKFLGLWDTVDAYVMPIEEIKIGIDRYIWPLALEDSNLDRRIEKACHALAIDEKRITFHPLLWNERGFPQEDHTNEERLTQVWFAGAHANVGGGYPDDGLSYVSLDWMIKEAKKKGLEFDERIVTEIEARSAPYGRLYDSRAYLGSYYRYDPRHLDPPRDKQGAEISDPKIHETVLWRMAAGTDAYAPLSLPSRLRIVSEILTGPVDGEVPDQQARPRKDILAFDEHRAAVIARQEQFFAPFANLAQADPHRLDLMWDTVWWRRVAYFVTLTVTALLIAYPFLRGRISWPDFQLANALTGLLSPGATAIADILTAFLPMTKPWAETLRADPLAITVLVAAVAGCYLWGALIDRRIHDRALAAWNATWRRRRNRWFRRSVKRRALGAALVIFLSVAAAVTTFYYAKYMDPGACEAGSLCIILTGILKPIFFSLMIVFMLIMIGTAISCFVLWKNSRQAQAEQTEMRGTALFLAHKMRTYDPLVRVYRSLATDVIPFLFAAAIVALVAVVLGRLIL